MAVGPGNGGQQYGFVVGQSYRTQDRGVALIRDNDSWIGPRTRRGLCCRHFDIKGRLSEPAAELAML